MDAEWKYAVSEVEKIKNDFAELDLRLQTLTTVLEATVEQMGEFMAWKQRFMGMMVQVVRQQTPPRTFSENIFSQEC